MIERSSLIQTSTPRTAMLTFTPRRMIQETVSQQRAFARPYVKSTYDVSCRCVELCQRRQQPRTRARGEIHLGRKLPSAYSSRDGRRKQEQGRQSTNADLINHSPAAVLTARVATNKTSPLMPTCDAICLERKLSSAYSSRDGRRKKEQAARST